MTRIKEIGHAVLYVRDPEASAKWYVDLLGMEVVAEPSQFPAVFLSFGRRDHDIALFKSDDAKDHGGRELNHLAFELDGGLADLQAFRRRLVERRETITGTVDHGISYGIYFLDPDGHQLEVFSQRTPDDEDAIAAFKKVGVMATPIDLMALTD
ncbi:MAG: VOC family protein [Pseudomonadota bacterium]